MKMLKLFLVSILTLTTSIYADNITTDIPLFKAYPQLKHNLPHVTLGNIDYTPVIQANSIGNSYSTKIYIKCDGATGTDKTGKKIFTGNKRRKLEFLLPDALAHGAKHIYALGGAGSNFATATAAYAKEIGLDCTLVLGPQRNTRYVQRNLKLDLFYKADIVACPTREERSAMCSYLSGKDATGYFVPLGGLNKIGAIGFVNAAFELKEQIEKGILPKPDVIYITVSSAGMAAGLIVGLKAAGLNITVKPVRIDDTPEEISHELSKLINETSSYLNEHDKSFPLVSISPENLNIINDMAGENYVKADHEKNSRNSIFDAYALITPEDSTAIKTLNDLAGIKLDGTYSGKAFAACLRDVISGDLKNKNVLFWSSFCSGDFSEYTNTVDTKKLPTELQKYINETYPIQQLDQGV